MILPKAFFVSFAQIPELLGVNAEASIPALAEAFGFSLRDTRIFTSPRNAGKRFWNTTEVRLEDLQGELGIKHGLKMFHPVKCQVTLDNLLEWTKNLLTTSDQKSIIN